ncbi:transposase [Kaistella anthropi]|nr:transposase [Kaistella anthropi]
MQGRKTFEPKIFYELSLEGSFQDDFYRKISQEVPFSFLYKSTSHYYGRCGQDSIDPVVFFKILLVGYLNNLNSDRALLRFCSDSLSIRLL